MRALDPSTFDGQLPAEEDGALATLVKLKLSEP